MKSGVVCFQPTCERVDDPIWWFWSAPRPSVCRQSIRTHEASNLLSLFSTEWKSKRSNYWSQHVLFVLLLLILHNNNNNNNYYYYWYNLYLLLVGCRISRRWTGPRCLQVSSGVFRCRPAPSAPLCCWCSGCFQMNTCRTCWWFWFWKLDLLAAHPESEPQLFTFCSAAARREAHASGASKRLSNIIINFHQQ